MNILFINSVCGVGSTGKICESLAKEMEQQGHNVKIACSPFYSISSDGRKYAYTIGSKKDVYTHYLKTRTIDAHGFGSKNATIQFIKWANEFNPDMLWMHNLHGYYINLPVLFAWIKQRPQMQVKWTLHDCWAFTGHCAYFDMANCDKWKTVCANCSEIREYPSCYGIDNSKTNYIKKREIFCGVKNLTIITPSRWLADLVKQSFLKEYPVEVIHNTINTDIFRPVSGSFRQSHHLQNKKIILGVANYWEQRKGYADLVKLAVELKDYVVIAVGRTTKECERITMPENFLSIQCTENQQQLAELYSAADVFFNPTLQDNYPTVNLEAEACGTPVVTYDAGGSKETVFRPDSVVIPKGDLNAAVQEIRKLCEGIM